MATSSRYVAPVGATLATGLLLLAGCSGPASFPIKGTVVFDDSGEPAKELAGYTVTLETFQPTDDGIRVSGSGVIDENGTFVVSTYGRNDGAAPGRHRVTINVPLPDGDEAPVESLILPGYSDPERSPLEVEVGPGTNEPVLRVERAKAGN